MLESIHSLILIAIFKEKAKLLWLGDILKELMLRVSVNQTLHFCNVCMKLKNESLMLCNEKLNYC